ncbi:MULTISPECIES: PadR family transcriptional regulator [Nocardia]|jgi:DNA-binding PadR family transcriptional regulator|uniref:PadR family transcriptional regulator n=1 Tax=Nocardia TaxID=1817 RepID=UPI0013594FBF|nr:MULTISPECIES: PadR family transcriptional regulator [Nocardia]MBF6203765.1 helix-turn-helix transcriptional regulator [Streptomyces gardneri]
MSAATRILVLGLLAQGPKHGYEIRRWLESSHAERWTDVKRGSVYHALASLERAGTAEVVETPESVPDSTARKVYRITAAGRAELTDLLRVGWGRIRGSYPRDLYTMLTFAEPLPRDELLGLRDRLRSELEVWSTATDAKSGLAEADLIALLLTNGRAHLEADLALIDQLLAR